jgi:hypothetical protein
MIKVTVIGSRYWENNIPVVVVYVGNAIYKDGLGNFYQEIEINEEGGTLVFEKMQDNFLAARYVKIMSKKEATL